MILISLMKNLDLQLMPTVTAATVFLLIVGAAWVAEGQIVIAHRGASGYLPEHTLASKALAYGMGADYIEQDVVLTSDDHAVVLHDIHLDTVTNVAEVFPDRARDNGRHFAIDFTLDEIRQLSVYERFSRETGAAVYTRRFPLHQARFSVPTLATFSDHFFDWIYIDANHTYESVRADLEACLSKVRPGGIIAGHDYINTTYWKDLNYGVVEAVDEFCAEHNWEIIYLTREPGNEINGRGNPSYALRQAGWAADETVQKPWWMRWAA